MTGTTLVVACGALARELVALQRQPGWSHLEISCLDARLHNTPALIPGAVVARIRHLRARSDYAQVVVAYADCGTAGALDAALAAEGEEVMRLPGAHCYELFAGSARFAELTDAEPGTFFLTDFLARHFDALVIAALKIDRHPELLPAYFGNYRRLVYLAQNPTPELEAAATAAAARLGLAYEFIDASDDPLARAMRQTLRLVNAA